MALSDNPFTSFTVPELNELRAAYKQCILDIAKAGQSYTMGRTFTRANLSEVRKTLAEIAQAISYVSGHAASMAVARVRPFCGAY